MRVSEGTALGSFWPTEKKATTESAKYDCREAVNGRLCLNVVSGNNLCAQTTGHRHIERHLDHEVIDYDQKGHCQVN